MYYDVMWEVTVNGNKTDGVARIVAEKTIDALNTFFMENKGQGKKLIGIISMYEDKKKENIS